MRVWLYQALAEFAAVGVDGTRAALAGEYTVRFGVRETVRGGMGFAEQALLAV